MRLENAVQWWWSAAQTRADEHRAGWWLLLIQYPKYFHGGPPSSRDHTKTSLHRWCVEPIPALDSATKAAVLGSYECAMKYSQPAWQNVTRFICARVVVVRWRAGRTRLVDVDAPDRFSVSAIMDKTASPHNSVIAVLVRRVRYWSHLCNPLYTNRASHIFPRNKNISWTKISSWEMVSIASWRSQSKNTTSCKSFFYQTLLYALPNAVNDLNQPWTVLYLMWVSSSP